MTRILSKVESLPLLPEAVPGGIVQGQAYFDSATRRITASDGTTPVSPLSAVQGYLPASKGVGALGARIVLYGHSLNTSGGTSTEDQGWHNKFTGLRRGMLTDYAKGGAVLGWSETGGGATGDGGVFSIFQLTTPAITAAGPKPYVPMQQLSVLDYGNNDLGWGKQLASYQQALRAAIARLMAARVFEEMDPSIQWSSGWTRIATPSAPTVSQTGTAGSTSYTYQIVPMIGGPLGIMGIPSSTTTTATGNATLSDSNFNHVTWSASTGATLYAIVRTAGGATQGIIGYTASSLFLNDKGLPALSAFTAPNASPPQVTASTASASGTGYVGPAAAAETVTIYIPADIETNCDFSIGIVVPGTWASGDPTFTYDGSAITPGGAAVSGVNLLGPTTISATKVNVTSGGTIGTNTATLASVSGLSAGMTVVGSDGVAKIIQSIASNVITIGGTWGTTVTYVTWNPLTTNGKNNAVVYRFTNPTAGNGAQQTALTGALSNGGTITSLTVPALTQAYPAGTTILLSYGGQRQTCVVSGGGAAAGATSVPVTSFTANGAYPVGAAVLPYSHTVVMTVGSRPGGGDQGWFFDYWQIEAQPDPLVLVCGLFKPLSYSLWSTPLPVDADVDTWNAAVKTMLGAGNEFQHAQFIDVDPFNKNAFYFSNDLVHPDDRGHSILAAYVSQQVEASPILGTLGADAIAAQTRGPRSVKYHSWSKVNTGNITVATTYYADMLSGGNPIEVSVIAMPGDDIELFISGAWAVSTILGVIDGAIVNNGLPIRYFSSGTIDASTNGIPSLMGNSANAGGFATVSASSFLTCQLGDLSGSPLRLTVRLRGYIASAGSRVLNAGGSVPLTVALKNLDQINQSGYSGGFTPD